MKSVVDDLGPPFKFAAVVDVLSNHPMLTMALDGTSEDGKKHIEWVHDIPVSRSKKRTMKRATDLLVGGRAKV